jgi:hypothetical protein
MIRRIVLENYMSHSNTVIEPAEGLTVLVGPNNCGKSAVVSALLTICGENDGDFMVRHGEKHARVTVETAEGDTIVWQRKRTPSYVINGREVHRVGRGNLPDDLQSLLKLPVIEFGEGAGRNRFLVHFGLQKEPIFLINSEADVARFFASSAESERLSDQRAIEADLLSITGQLESLTPLEAIGPQVEAVETEHRTLMEQRAAIDGLQGRIRQMETAGAEVMRQEARVAAVASLRAEPPAVEDERSLARVCEQMAGCTRDILTAQQRIASTVDLREPPVPEDVRPLIDFGKSLAAAEAAVQKLDARAAALGPLKEAPEIADVTPLAQAVERIGQAGARAVEYEKVEAKVAKELAAVRDEIVAWVTANPLCPVCGGAVQSERVLETGTPHGG